VSYAVSPDEPELREGEAFEHEFDDVPDGDQPAIRVIRDDFHRHGYTLEWLHPEAALWIMRWTPHEAPTTPVVGEGQDVGEYRGRDMTALEAAKHAWQKFGDSRGGG
jgi:hypothetical protein